ncbi:MAG: glycosyltransferase family 2 protein [Thermoanaerobaculales bacterium]|nr:glycosyltransferase family 2 protein [Thermoanaerobaculales bacterium]
MSPNALPPLSVVIPTHNTRELTLEAVTSVASQAPQDTEIIVVDDGSSDGTSQQLAQQLPAVTVIRNNTALGFSASANRGLSQARGRILLLLNSDAALRPSSLLPLREAFDDDPGLGIAGAELRYPDGTPQWSGGAFPTLPWLFALTSGAADLAGALPFYRRFKSPGTPPAGSIQWVTGAAMAIRRQVWTDLGPLDEGYRFYGQDLDLCRKACDAGWRVALIPGFVVSHHHGATIGAGDDAAGVANPEYLWTDILRFVRVNDGPGPAQRARWVMWIGARLRLGAMALALPLGSRHTREARRTRRALYSRAAKALR